VLYNEVGLLDSRLLGDPATVDSRRLLIKLLTRSSIWDLLSSGFLPGDDVLRQVSLYLHHEDWRISTYLSRPETGSFVGDLFLSQEPLSLQLLQTGLFGQNLIFA
jgi:hypothetical protein